MTCQGLVLERGLNALELTRDWGAESATDKRIHAFAVLGVAVVVALVVIFAVVYRNSRNVQASAPEGSLFSSWAAIPSGEMSSNELLPPMAPEGRLIRTGLSTGGVADAQGTISIFRDHLEFYPGRLAQGDGVQTLWLDFSDLQVWTAMKYDGITALLGLEFRGGSKVRFEIRRRRELIKTMTLVTGLHERQKRY